jgi:hypothetical protein
MQLPLRTTVLLSLLVVAGACSSTPTGSAKGPADAETTVSLSEKPARAPATSPVAAPEPPAAATASPEPEAPPATAVQRLELEDSPGSPELVAPAATLKAGNAAQARPELAKVVPELDKKASLDVRMAAHALWGRACQMDKDEKCAVKNYQAVLVLWKDPPAGQKQIESAGGDDAAKRERLSRALQAAGEAQFFFAEQKRALADKKYPPEYKGRGDHDHVKKHIETKVAPWVKAKRALVEGAEKEYAKILSLQPAPPARWVVDASARVGMMWGKFTAELRAAPIPDEWRKDGTAPGTTLTYREIRAAYYEAMDEVAKPLKDRARASFESCQALSSKLGYKDDFSKHCETWLAKVPRSP